MQALMLAAVIAALGPRPAELTGPDPSRYEAKIAEAARQLAAQARGETCADATLRSVQGLEPTAAWLKQNAISQAGTTGPVFQERIEVAGCGGPLQVRMLVAKRGDDWGLVGLPPGRGLVGPRLYRDMQLALAGVLGVKEAGLACGADERRATTRLADTELLAPYAAGAPWSERWTFSVCRQAIPLDIVFTPAADGGTNYSIKAR